MDSSAFCWKQFKRNPETNSMRESRLDSPSKAQEESMIELHYHQERATHHRSLDMLMEVQFVLEYAERSLTRMRALGLEPSVNTLEARSEFEQLQRGIHSLPADQALVQAEAIRARAQSLFVVLQA
jgi:hypothetical protein